jgi:hypothetical protein
VQTKTEMMSQTEATMMTQGGSSQQRRVLTPDDEDDSGDEEVRIVKRKADTDHLNPLFT